MPEITEKYNRKLLVAMFEQEIRVELLRFGVLSGWDQEDAARRANIARYNQQVEQGLWPRGDK